MVCQDDGSPSLVPEVPTIIAEEDAGVSEIAPSFVTKFADIMLRVAKQEVGRAALQLVILLAHTLSEMNIFK